jgi:flagellar assembly protein FliH
MSSWHKASLLSVCETTACVASCTFDELVPAALIPVREDAEPHHVPGAPAVDAPRAAAMSGPGNVVTEAEHERLLMEALAEGHALGFDAGREEGLAAGIAEGYRLGEEAEGARLRSAVAAAEKALAVIRDTESQWTGAVEENIAALAVAVARQILDREVRGSTAAFGELVRRALAEFPVDEPVRIRLHPSDLATISTLPVPGDEPLRVTGGREAAWVADVIIEPGGCLIEGRTRIIDGRVDTALERLYRSLTGNHA